MHKKPNEITLNFPIKRGEQIIDKISLNEPTLFNLKGLHLSEILQMKTQESATLIARIATPALTADEVQKMDLSDFVNIAVGVTAIFAAVDKNKNEGENDENEGDENKEEEPEKTNPLRAEITLSTPIVREIEAKNEGKNEGKNETKNETIKSIVLEKPNAGHLRDLSVFNLSRLSFDECATLVTRIAKPAVTMRDLRKVSAADLTKLCLAILNFLTYRAPTNKG